MFKFIPCLIICNCEVHEDTRSQEWLITCCWGWGNSGVTAPKQHQSTGESCESVGAHSVQWISNTSNPSSPTQGARYVYSWHCNSVCVCTCACAWILGHISVKWVCAHLMSITSLTVKLQNMYQIPFILHTVITNYKTFSLPLECKN